MAVAVVIDAVAFFGWILAGCPRTDTSPKRVFVFLFVVGADLYAPSATPDTSRPTRMIITRLCFALFAVMAVVFVDLAVAIIVLLVSAYLFRWVDLPDAWAKFECSARIKAADLSAFATTPDAEFFGFFGSFKTFTGEAERTTFTALVDLSVAVVVDAITDLGQGGLLAKALAPNSIETDLEAVATMIL